MRTLTVTLPITEREILVANDICDWTVVKIFEAIEPMVDEWLNNGIVDITSGMVITPGHDIFLDTMASEFAKLDFVTKIV